MARENQPEPIGFEIDPVLCPDTYASLRAKRIAFLQSLEHWQDEDVEEYLRYYLDYSQELGAGFVTANQLAKLAYDSRCPDEVSERYGRILNNPDRYLTPSLIRI